MAIRARGYALSRVPPPLTPTLSPLGRGSPRCTRQDFHSKQSCSSAHGRLFGASRQSRVTGTANERAHARRRVAIVAAERPVEIRHVPEPDIEGDRGDLQICVTWTGQQTIGPGEALRQHIVAKARAFLLEQPLDAARRAGVTSRK